MKKFIIFALILSLIFLSSCGKSLESDLTEANSDATVIYDETETFTKETESPLSSDETKTETHNNETTETKPSQKPTENNKNTEANAEKRTEKQTEKQAENVAERPTEKKTEKQTERSTERLTENPTEKVVEKSTEKRTEKQNEKRTGQNVTKPPEACVSLTITCVDILDHMDELEEGKEYFVPSDGVIFSSSSVSLKEDETVFDVLKRICSQNNIQLEYSYSGAFGSYYIEGINQIYEKDAGSLSGWNYYVNGEYPSVGCSSYKLKDGDSVQFVYTVE